jgi:hypothetical protein
MASRAKITLASFEVEGILDNGGNWYLVQGDASRYEIDPLADMIHSLIIYGITGPGYEKPVFGSAKNRWVRLGPPPKWRLTGRSAAPVRPSSLQRKTHTKDAGPQKKVAKLKVTWFSFL